ncbi:MAG: endolytic transglycosylase MltG [Flavobacteriales bacterium]
MKKGKLILLIALLLAFAAGIFGFEFWEGLFGPGKKFEGGDRIVLIPTGSTFDQVVDSLKDAGLVRNEATLRWLAKQKQYSGRIRPGRYRVPSGMSLNALLNKLRSGEQDSVRVTFTNIRNLPQLAGQVARYIEADSLQVIEAIQDPATIQRLGFKPETMIALFIPNTYEVWWTERPQAFLERMAREYRKFWTEERKQKAKKLGLSQSEVSTLASIVQAETAQIADAPIIAGVYLNRIRIGMPLQADPTLKYALGLDSLNRIWDADKRVDSPYNTYTHTGLPPGPINLPEARFLDATLNAQKHDYLYFCAREDLSGYSNFARTYEQHQANARRYQRALNERGIYR